MKLTTTAFSLACCLLLTQDAHSQAVFRVTEAFAGGISGPDGSEDWFEITNVGDAPGDTGTLRYDDSSAMPDGDPADGDMNGPLDSFILAPGESAVFLTGFLAADEAGEIDEFIATWGPGITVGSANSTANLGGGGDSVVLFSGFDGVDLLSATVVDFVSYGDGVAGDRFTIDFTSGSPVLSVEGLNGAFESNPFENDNFPPGATFPAGELTLVGSPGFAVPEPTSVALLAVAGCGVLARRRKV